MEEETQTNVINSSPISVIKKVKFTSIPCKPETRQALRELVQGKETWDALLLRMVEKCKQTP